MNPSVIHHLATTPLILAVSGTSAIELIHDDRKNGSLYEVKGIFGESDVGNLRSVVISGY
jgi:hypothetical protein